MINLIQTKQIHVSADTPSKSSKLVTGIKKKQLKKMHDFYFRREVENIFETNF